MSGKRPIVEQFPFVFLELDVFEGDKSQEGFGTFLCANYSVSLCWLDCDLRQIQKGVLKPRLVSCFIKKEPEGIISITNRYANFLWT